MGRWAMAATLGALATILGGPALAADSTDRPDAQMLLDLDLLREPDLTKNRDLYRRMGVVERMRMLEMLQTLDAEGQPKAVPSGPTQPATSRPPTPGGR